MISGNRSHRFIWTWFALLALPSSNATTSVDLIERLKVAAPSTIAFTEIRFSRLLKQPITVSGHLTYRSADQLDRSIEKPYRETTEIRGNFVRVTRDDERERTFALDRAPELRTLLRTFSSLLAGDRAALEQDFRLRTSESSTGPDSWTLELTPLDARVQRRLKSVSLLGAKETLRCLAIRTNDGGISVLLLGAAADSTPKTTPDMLLKHCSQ